MKIPRGLIKALTVIIVVGAIGYLTYIRVVPLFQESDDNVPEMTKEGDEKSRQQARPIEAGVVIRSDLIMRITAQGNIQPYKEIPIYARTNGELMDINVFEGKRVRKGSLIAAFDDTEIALNYREREAALKQSQAKYIYDGNIILDGEDNIAADGDRTQAFIDQAKRKWENADQLLESGAISKNEYDSRKRNYDAATALTGENRDDISAATSGLLSAQVNFERAKIELENTKLFAPMNGLIAKLTVQQNQRITAGTEICQVIDISKVRIKAGVLESEISDLEVGRKATVELAAYPNETFEGIVETISPVVEDKANTVTILIDNPDGRLKPGMFAFVRIDAKIYEDRLLVPYDAVLERDQKYLVLVIREGRTVWSYIERGLQNADYVEVLSAREGCEPGELVATGEHFTLAHDIPVRILNKIEGQENK
ncbi:MAG: efflux RND transporter periplasmic adaptor subunit [bacterium]|nr:efflux RND transporter periplasmic adaptor subunit [bacterium]